MPGDGVPLRTVFSDSEVERRIRIKHGLEADMAQHKQHTGAEHCSDKAPRVTCKTKRGEGTEEEEEEEEVSAVGLITQSSGVCVCVCVFYSGYACCCDTDVIMCVYKVTSWSVFEMQIINK